MSGGWVYVWDHYDCYTVGFHDPDGEWHPDTDWPTREQAAARVHYLNGGKEPTE